jgi:non-canonical (house-cleaning) NTP pyrophosphatase
MRIVVASKNPVKLNTAANGFGRMFPESQVDIVGVGVASGVSD